MGKTFINYNLVAQSSNNIGKKAEEVKNTSGVDGDLSELIDSIIKEGKDHDNCLALYEGELDEIVTDIDKSINKMNILSDLCMVVFDAFLEAESHIVDGVGTIVIDGTEFSDLQIESTGMKEYVYSFLDINNLSGSINPNNLEGPLSEEEWLRYETMFTRAMNEATSKKEKAAIAAIFMTSVYPHIPYDWGGGHYGYDVNCEESISKLLGETYYGIDCDFQENPRLRTYDCSGFVAWVLKEAGYPEEMWTYDENGTRLPTNVDTMVGRAQSTQEFGADFDINSCSVGDLAYMVGEDDVKTTQFKGDHIGVIVAIEGNEIVVAHVSAGGEGQANSAGIGYTRIDVTTGKVKSDSTAYSASRKNKVYFTHVAHI